MRRILDWVAIVSGVVGLVAIVITAAPLTAENAMVQIAKTLVVLTLVIVPYIVGRAMERVAHARSAANQQKYQLLAYQSLTGIKAEKTPTLFFDYFFKPGSAEEWQTPPSAEVPQRRFPRRIAGTRP